MSGIPVCKIRDIQDKPKLLFYINSQLNQKPRLSKKSDSPLAERVVATPRLRICLILAAGFPTHSERHWNRQTKTLVFLEIICQVNKNRFIPWLPFFEFHFLAQPRQPSLLKLINKDVWLCFSQATAKLTQFRIEIWIHLGLLWLRRAEHDSPSGFYVGLHSPSQVHCTAPPGPSFFAAVKPEQSENTEILTVYKY